MAPRVGKVLETSLYARDLPRLAAFYRDVLGLRVVVEQEGRHVFLAAGSSMLLLFDPDASRVPGGSSPPHGGAPGGVHVAFEVDALAPWRARLAERGVALEHETTWPNGVVSLYFRDPEGNLVELAEPELWPVGP